jgi:predicted dienelactone hydrolase
MIRMANNQLLSRGRVLITGLAAGALLAAPTTATAVPMDPEPAPASPAASAPVASETARAAVEVQPVTVELPAPSGRLEVGTTELHLVDPKRDDPRAPGGKRELMISLWYPAARFIGDSKLARYMPAKTAAFVDAPWSNAIQSPPGTFDFAESKTHARVGVPVKQGKHPVVLFSPGLGFSRFLNTALLEDLASQGYLVVAMDHTHESPVEFPGGRFVPGVESNPDADAYREAIATRTADARFVLDQVNELAGGGNPDPEHRQLPVGLGTAIDLRKVGMLGFSAGGFTTAMTMREDRRVAAGIDLDGTLQYNFEQGPLSEVAE